jgi:succinate dehydrogenase / fumarate reductase flavoprotein subunit
MADYQKYEHDVLVIGAGGAGLRAAIEASAGGVSVGMICKSLLGKAHTVMAEGGIAAALANVDERDDWRVHFADTMRGGQYVNNWRMAELHAREAPDRVRELEAWGAVFDRTPDGRILQRNFGGHKYPRLAHVGDRTGRMTGSGAASSSSRPRPSCWPPAASAALTRLPATVGNTRGMATRWPTMPGRS